MKAGLHAFFLAPRGAGGGGGTARVARVARTMRVMRTARSARLNAIQQQCVLPRLDFLSAGFG
ncbi:MULTISPECIES: hypothetical protein [Cupriavidus]